MIIKHLIFVFLICICTSMISSCKFSVRNVDHPVNITNIEQKTDQSLCWSVSEDSYWPGSNVIVDVDGPDLSVDMELSGLVWQPLIGKNSAVLWAVVNKPSELHRLVLNNGLFVNSEGFPKTMLYTDGTGSPDSEGITIPNYKEPFVFVATERNDTGSTDKISRLSVLRYDTSNSNKNLTATHEWDLTSDFEKYNIKVNSNKGFEAITFLSDGFLMKHGFVNQQAAQPYSPPKKEHFGGVFIIGLEQAIGVEKTGKLFAYSLFLDGSFEYMATIDSKLKKVVSLEFDSSSGVLWAGCDNKCKNKFSLLEINDAGKLIFKKSINPPTNLNIKGNNEGFAISDDSLIVNGNKPVIWAEDGDGKSLHQGELKAGRPCLYVEK